MKHKRKKVQKQRGNKTHGYGSMKKHRGAGHRGGRGMAGTGKRADTKKQSILHDKKYFGKHGFKTRKAKIKRLLKRVNVSQLQEQLKKLVTKEGSIFKVNITGKRDKFTKILSKGEIKDKWEITLFKGQISKRAQEKVEKAGGKIILIEKRAKAEKKDITSSNPKTIPAQPTKAGKGE